MGEVYFFSGIFALFAAGAVSERGKYCYHFDAIATRKLPWLRSNGVVSPATS
jgi:hypothetical protein